MTAIGQKSHGKGQDAASYSQSVPPKPRITVEDVSGEIDYWSTVVYCFILGARPPSTVVNGFIKRVWSGFSIDKISFMTNGIFIVRFKSKEHQLKALDYGPLMFDSKPVIVNEWRPEVCLVKHDVQVIPIWVKLQGLDIKFWGMNSLKKIGSGIGKVIKCDENTVRRNFLSFPRLLIEVNRDQDFPKEIVFVDELGRDKCVKVEYEWLPITCDKCKGIGHSQEQCKIEKRKDVPRKMWEPVALKPMAIQPVLHKQVVTKQPALGQKDKRKTPISLPLVSPVITLVVPPVRKVNIPTPARIFSRMARTGPNESSSSGTKGPGFTFMDALNSAIQISRRKLDGMGHKGGRIWLIWKPNLFTINVVEVTAQTIFAEVVDNVRGSSFRISLVYGFNKLAERGELWSALIRHAQWGLGLGLSLGILTMSCSPDERIGSEISWAEIKHFQEACSTCGLITLKTIGAFFTWNNKHEAGSRVFSRIDRVLGNNDWGIEFPDYVAKFIPEGLYDHSLCIISLRVQLNRRPTPFKYFNMWALADDFLDVINHTWSLSIQGTPMFQLTTKLKLLKKPMKDVNQKEPDDVNKAFELYYLELLGSAKEIQPVDTQVIERGRMVQDKHYDILLKSVKPDEIKAVMFSIPGTKAAGLDGYSSQFFKDSWEVTGGTVVNAVMDYFEHGRLLKQVNHTIITLIPKVGMPKLVTQFRPIACCNEVYKCITKLLCNRLSSVLPELVSDSQSAFVKGRDIVENILVCQDLVKLYNRNNCSPRVPLLQKKSLRNRLKMT
ncbi:uncharacterized protein LOC141641227 [Silene latifolia]|uniref:uncharacterized protein LOC141641227 n=1 Tax=Silene latifolia TaxID=37657 RepID=UPI003D775392